MNPVKSVTVNVVVNSEIFYNFSVFDGLYRKRGLFNAVIFATVMSVFALVCIIMLGDTFLGSLLFLIGWGFPAFRVWNCVRFAKAQIKYLDLDNPKTVYSLHFSDEPDGITVTNHGGGDDPLVYKWVDIHYAYRADGCIYLFVLPTKAYLLPDGQAVEGTEALWQIIKANLPEHKVQDRRKNKI